MHPPATAKGGDSGHTPPTSILARLQAYFRTRKHILLETFLKFDVDRRGLLSTCACVGGAWARGGGGMGVVNRHPSTPTLHL